MTAPLTGTVVFGDVVDSRHDPGSSAWLRALCADLDAAYPREDAPRVVRLHPGRRDPGPARAGRRPVPRGPPRGAAARRANPALGVRRRARWSPAAARRPSGPGRRSSPRARHRPGAKVHRDGLVALTGDPEADARLADLGPLLPALLDDLTPRQREVARLILLDDLRRSEAAERLKVSRATVSVIADRARVRHLEGLARALTAIFAEGAARPRAAAARSTVGLGIGGSHRLRERRRERRHGPRPDVARLRPPRRGLRAPERLDRA